VVTVLVGDEQREFTVHRKLLCDSCAFFQSYVDAIPSPASSSSRRKAGGGEDEDDDHEGDDDSVLWLPNEAPDMFELFVLWLYQRKRFHTFLDHALLALSADDRRAMRTNLVRLHLFAAVIDLPALQDAAMDALQDLYLRFDWDMSPAFVAFLYGDCEAAHAVRLRKWAVAMLAWTLHGAPDSRKEAAAMAAQVDRLFAAYPDLKADYGMHLHKMAESRADVRVKNPQLRLPANELRSGERYFGFRQCTFHSHRATVGEGTCPHALALGLHLEVPPRRPPRRRRPREREMEMETLEEMESDVSEDADADGEGPIISPVGDLNEISYLDLS
jgi:hypothetical protein